MTSKKSDQASSYLAVKVGTSIKLLELAQIIYVQAAGNYVGVVIISGQTMHTKETISHIANRLPEHVFIRIHRSLILNREYVREIRSRGKNYEFTLVNGVSLLSGVTYRKQIRGQFFVNLRRDSQLARNPYMLGKADQSAGSSAPQSEAVFAVKTRILPKVPEDN